jgi:hypothetical protein
MTETVRQAEGRLRGEELIEETDSMSLGARVEFVGALLDALRERFCLECGADRPCYCMRDD